MRRKNTLLTAAMSLVLAMSFSLTGCTKDTKEDKEKPPASKPAATTQPAENGNGGDDVGFGGDAMPSAAQKGTPENPWIIGMSQCNLGEPWRVQMNKDIAAEAKKHKNIKVLFKDAQNETTRQQDQVREFITQKVDLLIISPKESKPLTKPVAAAMAAGIPVVVLDRAVEGDKYTCFIGADNKLIGKAAGQYIAKVLNGKGKVVELKGLMTSTPGEDRHSGFIAGLGKNLGKGKIEIVYNSDCQWLEDKAVKDMQSVLSRFADVDLVYGHNDPMAHGAWVAARMEGKGREKTIKFVGIDALQHEGIQYVGHGILTATFYYPTGGAKSIEVALKILKGEKVPRKITLGTKIYTQGNVKKGGEEVKP